MSTQSQLVMDLSRILAPAVSSHVILEIAEDGEISADLPKLARALLAAGYRKVEAAK